MPLTLLAGQHVLEEGIVVILDPARLDRMLGRGEDDDLVGIHQARFGLGKQRPLFQPRRGRGRAKEPLVATIHPGHGLAGGTADGGRNLLYSALVTRGDVELKPGPVLEAFAALGPVDPVKRSQ